MQEQTDTSTDSCALITIMNADGIYLATYAALLLNLKLIRINYYHEDNRQVPISEVSMMSDTSFKCFSATLIISQKLLSHSPGTICGRSARIWSSSLSFGNLVV